jgi:hypothetical protein
MAFGLQNMTKRERNMVALAALSIALIGAYWYFLYSPKGGELDTLETRVAGNEDNPFVPRSKPYPLPPLRPFRTSEIFSKATKEMGLHPYPTPVAVNSEPYNGYPATTYCAWSGGFGPMNDERWHPGLTSVPEALAGRLPGRGPWRVHFHVPLHHAPAPPLSATTDVLRTAVAAVAAAPHGDEAHLDVETYTWSVLPAEAQPDGPAELVAGIAAELRWALAHLPTTPTDGPGPSVPGTPARSVA